MVVNHFANMVSHKMSIPVLYTNVGGPCNLLTVCPVSVFVSSYNDVRFH